MIVYLVSRGGVPKYVGLTKNSALKRWGEHVSEASRGGARPLCRAIRKHGPDAFDVTAIASSWDYELLKQLEQELILQYATRRNGGYNATDGGDGVLGLVHSAETRAVLSTKSAERMANPDARKAISAKLTGRKATPESRANQSAAMMGRVVSLETRRKQSAATIGRVVSQETVDKRAATISALGGLTHSLETRENMSLAHLAGTEPRRVGTASGVRNVYRTKEGRWMAKLCVKRQDIYVGTFETVSEASAAVAQKKQELLRAKG